jgi:hypothetical protein
LIVIEAKRRQAAYLQNLAIFKRAVSSLKFENSQIKHQAAVEGEKKKDRKVVSL